MNINSYPINELELKNSISSTIQNLKNTVYASMFGENSLKKLGDNLAFGFFIGYFSQLTNKEFSEEEIKHYLEVYLSCKKATKDLNQLLEISANQLCLAVMGKEEEPFIEDINHINDVVEDVNKIEIVPQVENGECPICLGEYNLLDELNYFLDCTCLVHADCFNDYVNSSIQENKLPIMCPICKKSEVNQKYIYDSLRSTGNSELIDKYEHFLLNYFMGKSKGKVCCCPTPGCGYMFINDTNEEKFICPMCENAYCLRCHVPYHEGRTCNQYKNDPMYDTAFLKLAKSIYTQCPSCNFWVEKTIGCDHVTCRCGTEFCYRCGEQYYNLVKNELRVHECFKNWAPVVVKKGGLPVKLSKKEKKKFRKFLNSRKKK